MSPLIGSTTLPIADAALVQAVLALTALLLARPALALLVSATSRLPGRVGHVASSAAAALRPGLTRRLLATVLGLGVPVVSALAATPPAAARVAHAAPDQPGAKATVIGTTGTTSRVAWPSLDAPPVHSRPLRLTEIVVAPGDTLWDIARRHLPPPARATAVARAWPAWYSANRDRIGPDPSLLRVGTPLRVPDLRRTGTSASHHHNPSPSPAPSQASALSLDPDRR